jgi:Na+/H+-translocating membrane pyrophosphatase
MASYSSQSPPSSTPPRRELGPSYADYALSTVLGIVIASLILLLANYITSLVYGADALLSIQSNKGFSLFATLIGVFLALAVSSTIRCWIVHNKNAPSR